jgi:hypothetical protein
MLSLILLCNRLDVIKLPVQLQHVCVQELMYNIGASAIMY